MSQTTPPQDTWLYTREEVQRILRVAIALANDHDPLLQVISTDKANVLAFSRLWRRVVTETFAAEAPAIKPKHKLADSAAMLMMKHPRMFGGILLADKTCVHSWGFRSSPSIFSR